MEDFPIVSIVTPTYNQAEYLAETIESVLSQDYPNLEYIVIDDGSTDDTQEVLKRFEGQIFVDRHENIGQVRTLNKGWERANGTYLGYLSSDDILYPNALTQLVNAIQSDPERACVFPNADLIDSSSRTIKRGVCREFDLAELVVRQECYIGPGAIFRKSDFVRVGGWKPELRLAPDREFWMRLAQVGSFAMVDKSLAGYRTHPGSYSYWEVSDEISREYVSVLDEYFEDEEVPAEIRNRKNEAYGYANLLRARNRFRVGDFRRGRDLYLDACQFHQPLGNVGVKGQLLRNVVSKPIRNFTTKIRNLVGKS